MRRWLWGLTRLAVGLAVLAYVVHLVHPDDLRPVLARHHLHWTALALAALAANVYVASWRWQLLLAALGVRERIAPLLRAIYVGAFYNLVLPGQLGGQAIKVMLLGRRSPALAAILASVAMDQVVVIVALFAVALVSAGFAPPLGHRTGWIIGFAIVLVAATLLLVFAVAPRLQARLFRRARHARWLRWFPDALRYQTSSTWRSLASYGREPLLLAAAIAQAVLFVATLAAMAFGLMRAVEIDLDPVTTTFVLTLALVAGVAPFTLAGLGTREAAFIGALAVFGVPRDRAAAFAILWLLLNTFADAVGGVMQFWHPRQTGTAQAPVPR